LNGVLENVEIGAEFFSKHMALKVYASLHSYLDFLGYFIFFNVYAQTVLWWL